jgi:hypothetical protein
MDGPSPSELNHSAILNLNFAPPSQTQTAETAAEQNCFTMDFRPLDQMDASDEAIEAHPYHPFYMFWAVKPAIIKQ